jgi:hypothetical protein
MKIGTGKQIFCVVTIMFESVEEAAQVAAAIGKMSTAEARCLSEATYGVRTGNVDSLYETFEALDRAVVAFTGRKRVM